MASDIFKSLLGKPVSDKPVKLVIKKNETLLYGSGVTKRKAEQAERDIEKSQAESYDFQANHKEEMGELIDLNLPSTLTDPSIVLDEYQLAAVEGLSNVQYGCLIGQAGVGKTTTIKALIASRISKIPVIDLNAGRIESQKTGVEDMNAAIAFCSFMGRAVQQIKRALPKDYHPMCMTIHSLLGYQPEYEERTHPDTGEEYTVKVFRPTFTALNKLPYREIYLDEAGSVPINLWNELVAALNSNCKIILMGDLNQLPPVTGRSVLGFAITKYPTYTLEKIHRNAGAIVVNADRIIHGKKPLQDKETFLVMDVPDSAFDAFQKTTGIIQALHKKGLFDPLADAFIVPQNKDTIGQEAFNERLVRYFNPTIKKDDVAINPPVIIQAGYVHATFAVGDKVMQLSNDKDLGLTNGMIGVVTGIRPNEKYKGEAVLDQVLDAFNAENTQLDLSNLHEEIKEAEKEKDEEETTEQQASHTTTVKFQNVETEVEYSAAGSYRKFAHSYAITCHKSQGGEYPTVVILCHSANLMMLNREWLYTAVTRAKTRVILLTNHRGLTHAVNRQLIKGKTIADKAQTFIKLSQGGDATMPNLPDPLQEIKF